MGIHPVWNSPFVSNSPRDTRSVARWMVEELDGCGIVALWGELGSGKTCFVQGIAEALEIARPVTSPTFTIVNEYCGTSPLFHIDFYRIRSVEEALALGFDEYLDRDGIVAVEWPERIGSLLDGYAAVDVRIAVLPEADRRRIEITRRVAAGRRE